MNTYSMQKLVLHGSVIITVVQVNVYVIQLSKLFDQKYIGHSESVNP